MSDELEQELKEALKRVPAPDGFADRVMERVGAEQQRLRVMPFRVAPVWQAAIAAVVLISLSLGGVGLWQRQQERRKAEIVQRQFEVAMRVTGKTLDDVGARVSRAGMKVEKERQ